jgi:hypothetical protein
MQDDTSPNAPYWKIEAETELTKLSHKIGKPAYRTWFEQTWPGDAVDRQSWKSIYDTAHAYLESLP